MPLITNGAEEMIKELSAQIEDVEGLVLEKVEEDGDAASNTQKDKEESTPGDKKEDAVGDEPVTKEVIEADATSDEDDALSDDIKKRGKAFGAMRAELREAKERGDKLELARQEQAERLARLEGRAEAGGVKDTPKEDAEPDSLLYPDDHNQWKLKQMEKRLEKAEAVAKEAAGFANFQKEQRGVGLLEQTFKTANPTEDYDGAAKFLVERERAMKKLMNPKLSDAEADAQTESEKVGLFKSLYAQGRDPARIVVDMAKAQGYTGANKTPNGSNGETKQKVDLNKVADNQRRSSNLIGGSPANSKDSKKLSTDDVFSMSFKNVLKNHEQLKAMVDGEGE